MWEHIKDGLCLLGYAEVLCYAVKGLVYLTDKIESSKNEIVDPVEQKMIKNFCVCQHLSILVMFINQ